MDTLVPAGPEEIIFEGKLFEIVRQPMAAGSHRVSFELARRAPGTRLIIVKDGKMLLAKEYRTELNGFDYRLPGGKVFDSLKEYRAALANNADVLAHATKAAEKECLEEVGLVPTSIKHFQTAACGATVKWDLFYFVVDGFKEAEGGRALEVGEVIFPEWKTFDEVKQLCANNEIREDRTVGVLYRFFLLNKQA